MKSALLVEDNDSQRQSKEGLLRAAGFEVGAPDGIRMRDFHDAIRQALDKSSGILDLLVLDVNLGGDHFGGIDLHNKLVDGGYRRRWRNAFIWTMHTNSDIASAVYQQSSDNEQYILRVFCETAGIPYQNVWRTGFGGNDALVARLKEIVSLIPDRHCRHCGRPHQGDDGDVVFQM